MLFFITLGILFTLSAGTCPTGYKYTYGNACYHRVIGYSSYADARRYCNAKSGGNVVTIESEGERAFVDNEIFISPRRVYWIGLNYTGRWSWVDGSTSTFRYWRGATPTPSGQQCVMAGFVSPYDGRWDMTSCTARQPYQGVICKYGSAGGTTRTTTTTTTTAGPVQPTNCAVNGDTDCPPNGLCEIGVCRPKGQTCTLPDTCGTYNYDYLAEYDKHECRYSYCAQAAKPCDMAGRECDVNTICSGISADRMACVLKSNLQICGQSGTNEPPTLDCYNAKVGPRVCTSNIPGQAGYCYLEPRYVVNGTGGTCGC